MDRREGETHSEERERRKDKSNLASRTAGQPLVNLTRDSRCMKGICIVSKAVRGGGIEKRRDEKTNHSPFEAHFLHLSSFFHFTYKLDAVQIVTHSLYFSGADGQVVAVHTFTRSPVDSLYNSVTHILHLIISFHVK